MLDSEISRSAINNSMDDSLIFLAMHRKLMPSPQEFQNNKFHDTNIVILG